MSKFDPRKLTWAALLGRWMEFARSALALPDDAEGRAWRQAVPAIIGLQAVAMALSEAGELDREQRALGCDRARVLIERHRNELHGIFGPDALQPMLRELIDDAEAALRRAEAIDEAQ